MSHLVTSSTGDSGMDNPAFDNHTPVKTRQNRPQSTQLKASRPASAITATSVKTYFNAEGIDFKNQSIPHPTLEGARINFLADAEDINDFREDGINTVLDNFNKGLSLAGSKNCLGWKPTPETPYQWMTYREVDKRSTDFGAGLLALGVEPTSESRLGIYSQNRPEYQIATIGMLKHSVVHVPLYDTLGQDALTYIVNFTELSLIICDNNEKVQKLLQQHTSLQVVTTIIVIDQASEENKNLANEMGVTLVNMEQVEILGRENPVALHPPREEDLYIICFTSGTTGKPKGVMITNKNLASVVAAGNHGLDYAGFGFTCEDVMISYLPLAHVYGIILEIGMLGKGAQIGYFQGDVKKLLDDIKELRPTIFPSVPRLLNRLYDKVIQGVNASKIKKLLFNFAVKRKTKEIEKGIIKNTSIWDKLVFKKVQQAMGGRCRYVVTGSAPISKEVMAVLRCMFGCPLFEGYGLSETTGPLSATAAGDPETGHVGAPIICCAVKLVDVPDLNYYSKDNKGEVCAKGPHIFTGYFRDPEKTRETIDEDGWLHTGDIGQWTENGTLRIIDRKKHIFKLSQGEYIAPEKIENILVRSEYIAQVYVHGDSYQSCLVGVVVLDPDTISSLAEKLGVKGTPDELCHNQILKDAILKDFGTIGKASGLSSLEMLKDIHIHDDLFSVENGFLTPTFKTKRADVQRFFSPQITQMYQNLKSK